MKGVIIDMDETFILGVNIKGVTVYMEVAVSEISHERFSIHEQGSWSTSLTVVRAAFEDTPKDVDFIGDEPKRIEV